jgi:presenilin-like A22 family membrane protease
MVAKISPQYLYFSILCYCVSFLFIKISILAQYRRIFSVDTTTRIINVVMAITISSGIAALFTFMFACVPIDAFWNVLKRPSAKCVDSEMYNRICVFVTNHMLILIPAPTMHTAP